MSLPVPRATLLAVVGIALVSVFSYLLGVHNTRQATWHSATVDVAAVAADATSPHRLLSIEADGWTYSIEDSVLWIDAGGVLHDGGWPACLEPARPDGASRSHHEVRFRFAEVSTDTTVVRWRPVVMVDCQPVMT